MCVNITFLSQMVAVADFNVRNAMISHFRLHLTADSFLENKIKTMANSSSISNSSITTTTCVCVLEIITIVQINNESPSIQFSSFYNCLANWSEWVRVKVWQTICRNKRKHTKQQHLTMCIWKCGLIAFLHIFLCFVYTILYEVSIDVSHASTQPKQTIV